MRLFKTRSKAAEACRKDRVRINGRHIKPAQAVKSCDTIEVKYVPIWRSYDVLGFPKTRVGAALVSEFLSETTTEEEHEKWKAYQNVQREQFIYSPSKGRPTKRDRRKIDRFKDDD